MHIDRVEQYDELPLLARYLRQVRERAGLSRAQLAARGHLSASLVEKWELEGRIPTPDKLAAWFDALDVPYWYREKIISLCQPELYQLDYGVWPAVMLPTDAAHLERFPDPACYQLLPTYDLIGANQAFRRLFPGLAPSGPKHRPTNIIEWMMLDPRARGAVRNWRQRTHVMLSALRVIAPGLAPQERIDEIIANCKAVPEFRDMWSTDPTEDDVLDNTVVAYDSDLEDWVPLTSRSYRCETPRRPWDLYVLTPAA